MTMVGGMQGYTLGDAAFHRNEPDYQRELAQAKELLANQAAYIRTLQEENLRLNKRPTDRRCEICGYMEHHREHTSCLRVKTAEQEALIAELVEILRKINNNPCSASSVAFLSKKALEKVNGK